MKNRKVYVPLVALALALASGALLYAFVGRNVTRAATPGGDTLGALPASDFVIHVDAQRIMADIVPAMFSSNPAMLAKMNAQLEKFEKETGINPRLIDSVAVGGKLTPTSAQHDVVVIVRGRFKSGEAINAAFAAAERKGQPVRKTEEQYGGKTIYVVAPPPPRQRPAVTTTNTNTTGTLRPAAPKTQGSRSIALPGAGVVVGLGDGGDATGSADAGTGGASRVGRAPEQMAVVALNENTIAVGDVKGVRAAIDTAGGRGAGVDSEIIALATRTSGAVVGFAGKVRAAMTEKLASGKGPEAQYFASIRQFYGSFSMAGAEADTFIAAITEKDSQAQEIGSALNALKTFGSMGMASQSASNGPPVAELLNNLSITTQGNEVQVKLRFNPANFARSVPGLQ